MWYRVWTCTCGQASRVALQSEPGGDDIAIYQEPNFAWERQEKRWRIVLCLTVLGYRGEAHIVAGRSGMSSDIVDGKGAKEIEEDLAGYHALYKVARRLQGSHLGRDAYHVLKHVI